MYIMMMKNYHMKPEEVDEMDATLLDMIKIIEDEGAKEMERGRSRR